MPWRIAPFPSGSGGIWLPKLGAQVKICLTRTFPMQKQRELGELSRAFLFVCLSLPTKQMTFGEPKEISRPLGNPFQSCADQPFFLGYCRTDYDHTKTTKGLRLMKSLLLFLFRGETQCLKLAKCRILWCLFEILESILNKK